MAAADFASLGRTRMIASLRPRQQGSPANPKQLEQLERALGELPFDLRDLFETANGAWIPQVSIPSAACPEVPGGGIGGNRLFSLEELLQARDDYEGRVSSDLLVFGNDDFGNALCIGLRGHRHGKVYFWDHEDDVAGALALGMDADQKRIHQNEHFVADSLRLFLSLFRDAD
jgi:hypothetical protein